MAQIRNISDDDRLVPDLGGRLVMAGQVVDVDDADVHAFTRQSAVWAPVDQAAQFAHDAGELQLAQALGVPDGIEQPAPIDEPPAQDGRPGPTARRQTWIEWLVSHGHDEAALADLTQRQLIALADQDQEG